MKKQMLSGFFAGLLILIALPPVHAQIGRVYSLPETVQHSNAICIGTVDSAPDDTSDPSGETIVTVRQVLKGNISGAKIKIEHGNSQFQWRPPMRNGLIFLGQSSPSGVWHYVDSPVFLGAVINLGDAPLPAIPKGLTPLRAALLTLAQALPNIVDKNYRFGLLDNIQEGFCLYQPQDSVYEKLAQNLGETTGFREFCTKQVLPLIIKNSHDPDLYVRANALRTAALLQDEAIMPQLRTLAEKGDPNNTFQIGYANIAGEALGVFHSPHSVPFMLSALHSHSKQVQEGALSSLVGTLHQDALPVLLDRVESRDKGTQSMGIYWLGKVTDMKVKDADWSSGHLESYIQYWKTWEQAHQEEVQALRTKLYAQSR